MLKFYAASLFILASVVSAQAQEAKQVKDEASYRELIVDKKWTHAWGKTWVKVHSDGTISGDSPRGKIKGTWVWKGSKSCRNGTVGGKQLKEDCQKFYMIGDRIMKNVTSSAPKGNYYFLK